MIKPLDIVDMPTRSPQTSDPVAWAEFNARQAGAAGLTAAEYESELAGAPEVFSSVLDTQIAVLTPSGEVIAAVRKILNRLYELESEAAKLLHRSKSRKILKGLHALESEAADLLHRLESDQ